MKKNYLLIFTNTLEAIEGENILKENNIHVIIMPTPTNITKSCGISIRVESDYIDKVINLRQSGKIKIKNIYIEENCNYKLFI